MQEYKKKIQESLPNIYSKDLLESIFQQPYCKIQSLVDKGIAQRRTASSYLKKLSEINLLCPMQIGRHNFYVNPDLIKILNTPSN